MHKENVKAYVAGNILGLVPVWNGEKKTQVDAKLILKSTDSTGPSAYFSYDACVYLYIAFVTFNERIKVKKLTVRPVLQSARASGGDQGSL